VSLELVDSWSLATIVGEHFQDEVFELLRKAVATNLLPVSVKLIVQDQIVEVLIFLRLLEWEDSLNDNEKNDTGRKNVDLPTIILFSFFDLGSHVSHCSSVGLQLVDLFVCGKSEISHLEVDLVIN